MSTAPPPAGAASRLVLRAKRLEMQAAHRLGERIALVDALRECIHALQHERGASSVYLASGGERFAQERLDAIAAGAPALARLAALDAVMERMLGAPERRLLDALPGLLEKRFAQLRAAATADAETAGDAPAAAAWQTGFQHDLEAALHAELDLRWHPIRALLAALHTPDHAHAVA